MAYTPQTATEFTICTFHNRNLIPVVSGATGMQITSQVHSQADQRSFLSIPLFTPLGFPWEGNASTQGRRDPTALQPVPPGGLGYALCKPPQSDERTLLDLPISQDNYQVFTGICSRVSCRPRTLFK